MKLLGRDGVWTWSDLGLIVAISGGLLLAGIRWPACWPLFELLPLVGLPLFVFALPFWCLWSVHRGMAWRTRHAVSARVVGSTLVVSGRERRVVDLREVASARLAYNDNWTESKLVADALTLFDARGRPLLKLAETADGFGALKNLMRSQRRLREVAVDAPAYLD